MALGLLAFEMHRLLTKRDEPFGSRLLDFLATGVPFVIAGLLMLVSPTLAPRRRNPMGAVGKIGRPAAGLSRSTTTPIAFILIAAVAAALAWAVH